MYRVERQEINADFIVENSSEYKKVQTDKAIFKDSFLKPHGFLLTTVTQFVKKNTDVRIHTTTF